MESGRAACLISRPVISSDGLTEGVAQSAALLGSLNGLDATPFLPTFSFDLAHFWTGMMPTTVIAVNGFWGGHGCAG